MQYLKDFFTLLLDRRVSWTSKLLVFLAIVAYILLPIDLIPDFLLPLGIVDDGGFVLAAVVAFTRQAHQQVAKKSQAEAQVLPAAEDDQLVASEHAPPASPVVAQPIIIQQPGRGGVDCGCLALLATLLVAPVIGFGIVLYTTSLSLSGIVGPVLDFINPPRTVNIVSSRTILDSLQELGKLVTVRSEFAQPDLLVEIDEGILSSGYHSANHFVQGSIEAGVDLSQFDRDDMRIDPATGSIHLNLPPPIITTCNIEYIDQNEHSIAVLPKDWDALRQLAEYEALMEFQQDAEEKERILEKAKEGIRDRLGSFINTLTGAQVHIDFDESGKSQFDETCYPEPPDDWAIDDDGEWHRTN